MQGVEVGKMRITVYDERVMMHRETRETDELWRTAGQERVKHEQEGIGTGQERAGQRWTARGQTELAVKHLPGDM